MISRYRISRYRLAAGLCAATVFLVQVPAGAQEDTTAHSDTNARKFVARNEKPWSRRPAGGRDHRDAMIDAGGQHIAYTAIAGTITVGATDIDDAQLGPDGNPQPGSELALNAPKEPKDAPPTARMFYVAYIQDGRKAGGAPHHISL